jgi:hypothetical protein
MEQPTYSIFVFVFDFDRKKPNSFEQVKLVVVAFSRRDRINDAVTSRDWHTDAEAHNPDTGETSELCAIRG